jgi:hypothetical protein
MVVNTVTERKSDVLLVVPTAILKGFCLEDTARREMSSARYQIHWAVSQWYAASRRMTCPIAGNGK